MQTKTLNKVLDHLQATFAFDEKETRKLLAMLHKTLTESVPGLNSGQSDKIYVKSHKLHSELHICGCEELSDLAMEIEIKAKKGIVEQALIENLLSRSSAFAAEIELWLGDE